MALVALDPLTLEPAAALATHYAVDTSGTRYTFFLRGHSRPRGIRLRDTDSLSQWFSAGRKAPAERTPALWSNGSPATAHDFVYSWRRLADPATAAPMAFYLAPLANADEVTRGAKPPSMLAVHAIDDLTFEFEMVAPIPSFVKLLWQPLLAAVPRLSLEAAGQHGRETFVSSGPLV